MSSCINNISNIIANNLISTIPIIQSNIRTEYSITPLNSIVYSLETNKNETVKFIIELASIVSINATLTIYRFNALDNTFNNIGGININENYMAFQKDLLEGFYFICIKINNNANYTGFITGEFSGFISSAKFAPKNYYGFYSETNLSFNIKIIPCTYPLWYEVIEGSLPEGVSFNNSGMLTGILPNLDCMESNYKHSPSANWYDDITTGEVYPWGRAWRFKIRVYIQEFPDMALAEKWLCIRVYNNWDLEKDALLNSLPLQKNYEIIVEPDPITLPTTLCPNTCTIPIIEPVIPSDCVDCQESINTSIQLIKIPETLKIDKDNFITWWIENNSNDFFTREEKYFITTLNNSTIFNILLKKTGIIKTTKLVFEKYKNTKISLNQINNFIELRLSVQINNRNTTDIDYGYLISKSEVNHNLEIELLSYFSQFQSSFTLST